MTNTFRIGLLTAALCCAFNRPAAATLVNCSNNPGACDAILGSGLHPWIRVDGRQGTWLDVDNPTQIHYAYSDSNVAETASGSLATGILKSTAHALQVYNDADDIQIQTNDLYTISGPPGSVSLTARLRASGVANFPPVGPGGSVLIDGGDADIELCVLSHCAGDVFRQEGGPPFAGYVGPIYSVNNPSQQFLELDVKFTSKTGVPFRMTYGMNASVYSGSMIDLTDPGTLDFVLPAGYSITSAGGFSSAVPEPTTIVLVALGLVPVLLRRRR